MKEEEREKEITLMTMSLVIGGFWWFGGEGEGWVIVDGILRASRVLYKQY